MVIILTDGKRFKYNVGKTQVNAKYNTILKTRETFM